VTRRRPIRTALLTAGTLLAGIALVAVIQLRPPAWWTPPSLAGPDATRMSPDVGERFEQACVSELYRIRESTAPWAIRIRAEEVNAWLTQRFPQWCSHVGIEPLPDIQVHFEAGAVEIATAIADLPSVAVARLEPAINGQWLRPNLGTMRLGRLPVPFLAESTMSVAIESLGGESDEDLRSVVLPLLRGEGVDATFELADRRRVRLRDLEVRNGEILLEFETLPSDQQ
jgi:hypothetical protein